MGRRAHDECIAGAEYGELMAATQEHIRETLGAARSERGVSQQRLAAVIGVNREAMRDRLLGRTQVKAEELAALAAFLELDIRELFLVPSEH
jgi:transcriptional regulator with XRE-family HTH domain